MGVDGIGEVGDWTSEGQAIKLSPNKKACIKSIIITVKGLLSNKQKETWN